MAVIAFTKSAALAVQGHAGQPPIGALPWTEVRALAYREISQQVLLNKSLGYCVCGVLTSDSKSINHSIQHPATSILAAPALLSGRYQNSIAPSYKITTFLERIPWVIPHRRRNHALLQDYSHSLLYWTAKKDARCAQRFGPTKTNGDSLQASQSFNCWSDYENKRASCGIRSGDGPIRR